MNEERLLELLSAAADGALSGAEREELDNLIDTSPDAARIQAELAQFEELLAEVPSLDPPAGLQEEIINSIVLPERRAIPSIVESLRQIRFGAVLRYGFSMAVGAMLAVTVYESQPKFSLATDITEVVGTMAPDSDSAGRKVLDSFSVSAIGVSSLARLEQRDDTLVLDVRIDTSKALDMAFYFDDTGFEFEALAQTLNNLDSIEYANQVLKVRGRGQGRFAVLMRPRGEAPFAQETQIRLEYSSDGSIFQQGMLSSGR